MSRMYQALDVLNLHEYVNLNYISQFAAFIHDRGDEWKPTQNCHLGILFGAYLHPCIFSNWLIMW